MIDIIAAVYTQRTCTHRLICCGCELKETKILFINVWANRGWSIMKAETKEHPLPRSMLWQPNTTQGRGDFSYNQLTLWLHWQSYSCSWWEGLDAPLKIISLLCSASMLSMKPSNNLASHMLTSHYIIINKHLVSVNLIKASLSLRVDRANSSVFSKIRFLNLQAWYQTLGCVNSSR